MKLKDRRGWLKVLPKLFFVRSLKIVMHKFKRMKKKCKAMNDFGGFFSYFQRKRIGIFFVLTEKFFVLTDEYMIYNIVF